MFFGGLSYGTPLTQDWCNPAGQGLGYKLQHAVAPAAPDVAYILRQPPQVIWIAVIVVTGDDETTDAFGNCAGPSGIKRRPKPTLSDNEHSSYHPPDFSIINSICSLTLVGLWCTMQNTFSEMGNGCCKKTKKTGMEFN